MSDSLFPPGFSLTARNSVFNLVLIETFGDGEPRTIIRLLWLSLLNRLRIILGVYTTLFLFTIHSICKYLAPLEWDFGLDPDSLRGEEKSSWMVGLIGYYPPVYVCHHPSRHTLVVGLAFVRSEGRHSWWCPWNLYKSTWVARCTFGHLILLDGIDCRFCHCKQLNHIYQVTIRSGGAGQFGIVTGKLYVFHSCSSSSASVCISIQIHSVVGLFIAGSNLRDSPQSTSVSLLQVPSSQHSSLHIELSPLLGRRTFILRVLIAKLSKSSSSRLPFILEFSSSTFPSWFTVASLTDIYRQFLHVPWRVSILGPK